jgi:tetratricopeptide (TPR) repeat protein
LALLFWSCVGGFATGEDARSTFDQGNRLYEEGKFAEAAAAYEKILQGGRSSPAVYFNLGNALFKSGRVGRAILNYRLAEQLAPRDPDIRANLKFARKSADDGGAQTADWRQRLTGRLAINEWTLLAAGAPWLWFTLLALGRWRPALKKALSGYTGTLGVAAALLTFCLCLACYDRFEIRTAVVTVREAVVRYGPMNESQSCFTVRDGAELSVLDAQGDWIQVTDRSRRIGWVRREQVSLFPDSHAPVSSS